MCSRLIVYSMGSRVKQRAPSAFLALLLSEQRDPEGSGAHVVWTTRLSLVPSRIRSTTWVSAMSRRRGTWDTNRHLPVGPLRRCSMSICDYPSCFGGASRWSHTARISRPERSAFGCLPCLCPFPPSSILWVASQSSAEMIALCSPSRTSPPKRTLLARRPGTRWDYLSLSISSWNRSSDARHRVNSPSSFKSVEVILPRATAFSRIDRARSMLSRQRSPRASPSRS